MNFILIKNVIILLLSLIFLIFGFDVLVGSFNLNNPLEFVVTLFSASFIILLCITGILYAFFRIFPPKSKTE